MADIPSSLNKFNDQEISDNAPVTEALFYKMGANSNYLVDFFKNTPVGMATFTASGSWTAPSNVKLVIAVGIGGGGGGGGAYPGDANNIGRGNGGGGSGVSAVVPCIVTPGTSYTITIGAAGAGGGPGGPGSNGTATSFGTLATFDAGQGGGQGRPTIGGAGGSAGAPSPIQPSGDKQQFGGAGGGGWRSSQFPTLANVANPPANSGAGGTGGGFTTNGALAGGNGAAGMLYLFWFTQP